MNTNMIKRIGFLAIGALTGGTIGYYLGNLLVDKLYQIQSEREEDFHISSDKRVPEEVVKVKKKKNYDYTQHSKGELSELVKPYTTSIDEKVFVIEGEAGTLEKSEKITVIDLETYESDRGHNKEPITFYEKDNTFANVQEEIIDDPTYLFGPNIHLHFGEGNDDPDIVYVRNDNVGVDYEISRVHNSYSVIVMGMPEEAPKPKRRKKTRKVSDNGNEDEDESED